ncbi:hypothetical protein D3C74_404290 [compost metagenome]
MASKVEISKAMGVLPMNTRIWTHSASSGTAPVACRVLNPVFMKIRTSGKSSRLSTTPKLGGFSWSSLGLPSSSGTETIWVRAASTSASRYPATYQVGRPTSSPTMSTRPTSAPTIPAAATGPGCGGTSACMTRNAPAEGSA